MSHGRVLIVDDDAGVRNDLKKTLGRSGFEVKVAIDCPSGWKAYREDQFDLVILDLVMPDFEQRFCATGGIKLLERIVGARERSQGVAGDREQCIWIVTATTAPETRRQALIKGASEYIDKAELYSRFPELMRGFVGRSEPRSVSLETTTAKGIARSEASSQNTLDEADSPKIVTGTIKLREDEKDLLGKLYSDCSQISVSPLASSFRKSRILRVECLDRNGRPTLPFVSKIGLGKELREEEEAFRNHVRFKLGSARYAELIDTVYSRDDSLGCSRMSFVGTDWSEVIDFRAFFVQSETREVCSALESLFEHTLGTWHRSKEPVKPLQLVPAYHLFGGPGRIRERVNNFLKQRKDQQVLSLDLCPRPFFEPAKAMSELLDSFAGRSVETHRSTIHGDLNVSNILVDGGGDCWLLDFQQTSVGPILRDFIELESSIKYSCLEAAPADLWDLEQALMAQEHFREDIRGDHHNPEIAKALMAVRTIREYAFYAVAPSRDMTEYYFGLLFHTLGLLRFPKKVLGNDLKEVALLAATSIFDRFKKPKQRMGFAAANQQKRYTISSDGETSKLLLIDDDAHLRKDFAKRLIRTGRYEVFQASSAFEGQDLVAEHGHDAALCIVDMQMPDLDGELSKTAGLDLLELIHGRCPLLPVVVMSGATDQKVALDAIRHHGAVTFIPKAEAAADPAAFLAEIEQIIKEAGQLEMDRHQRTKAAEVFRSTLSPPLPSFNGVEGVSFFDAKEDLGGDFWDWSNPTEKELRFLIADATGKSVPGAMQVIRLKSYYESSGLPTLDALKETVSDWNRYLFTKKTTSEHVTLFAGVLNLQTGELSYCNAGHDPPLVVCRNGSIETLDASGPILGAISDASYTIGKHLLQDGDLVVLYTDGFVESEAPDGTELGVEWLRETVLRMRSRPVLDIRQEILSTFAGLVESGKVNDDRTLLLLKRSKWNSQTSQAPWPELKETQ